jgi:deazaflavin-dependent oxidoreductase (nitroreductase family)
LAKTFKPTFLYHTINTINIALLRSGIKMGNMILLTVRGRKSGQPRTVPLVIIERKGKRYVGSPYGIVDWVRNLREAGEATLTRGRRSETVNARELPTGEVAIPSLATLASPRTRHLRSLIVRRSAIQSLSWKGNSAGGRLGGIVGCLHSLEAHPGSRGEQLMAAHKAGATLAELHRLTSVGESPPAHSMNLHTLL